MKLLKSAISLLNRSSFKEPIFNHSRFYSNSKSVSNESGTSVSQQNETQVEIERPPNQSAVESDLDSGILITSYNTHGFRLNWNLQVIGPIILFPRAVFSWHIESVSKIDADSLMIFSVIQPKVDNLIIGIGEHETTTNLGRTILDFSHNHKICVDVLTTELACTHFNLLQSEGRMVAAALLPPKGLTWREDDIFETLSFDNNLFTIDNMHMPEIKGYRKPKPETEPKSKPES